MNSIIHEVGWRTVSYCFFVFGVSLFSLITLIRQTLQERRSQIKAELSRAIRADQDEDDPVNVLNRTPKKRNGLLPRYLMIVAHAMVILGSLYVGWPAAKSALYTHRGNNSSAEHDYDTAVKSYSSALEASQYAKTLMDQYQLSIARRDAKGGELGDERRMVGLHPGNEGYHNDLGNQLIQHGDLDNAIKEYRMAVSLKPDNPIVHNNLGNALKAAKRYPEAIAEFRRAIQLAPDQVPTYYNIANTLMENNQTDEAIGYYHIAIQKNPKMAPAYYNLAQALAKQNDRDGAITAMDTYLQIAPKIPQLAGTVANAKKQLEDWRKTP